MSNALDAFRAQREAVEALRGQLFEVAELLRSIEAQADALIHNGPLRALLQEEQSWLRRAEEVVARAEHFREREVNQFWPVVWRRWVAAVLFALVSVAAAGAGYVWAGYPHETELIALRTRAELLDIVAQRIIKMTPAERRQFDALMKGERR